MRIFTFKALNDLLKKSGFKIVAHKGAIYDEGLPKILWPIDRILSLHTQLAPNIIILAQKFK